MKLNTLFVAAICAGTLLNSCVNKTAQERQLAYTQTSLVDGDAFFAIQKIGEAALVGSQYAERAGASADANGQAVAGKVKSFYDQLIPELDRIATLVQVDFPIKGIPAIDAEESVEADTASTDTTDVAQEVAAPQTHRDYVSQAQDEIAIIKEQLKRMTRNTNVDIQQFAKAQLETANELFTAIGGKEEAHAHH